MFVFCLVEQDIKHTFAACLWRSGGKWFSIVMITGYGEPTKAYWLITFRQSENDTAFVKVLSKYEKTKEKQEDLVPF